MILLLGFWGATAPRRGHPPPCTVACEQRFSGFPRIPAFTSRKGPILTGGRHSGGGERSEPPGASRNDQIP
jgi:hypothetical protein